MVFQPEECAIFIFPTTRDTTEPDGRDLSRRANARLTLHFRDRAPGLPEAYPILPAPPRASLTPVGHLHDRAGTDAGAIEGATVMGGKTTKAITVRRTCGHVPAVIQFGAIYASFLDHVGLPTTGLPALCAERLTPREEA